MYYATHQDTNVHVFKTKAERDEWIAIASERHMIGCHAITSSDARGIALWGRYVQLHFEDYYEAPRWLSDRLDRDYESYWDDEENAWVCANGWTLYK